MQFSKMELLVYWICIWGSEPWRLIYLPVFTFVKRGLQSPIDPRKITNSSLLANQAIGVISEVYLSFPGRLNRYLEWMTDIVAASGISAICHLRARCLNNKHTIFKEAISWRFLLHTSNRIGAVFFVGIVLLDSSVIELTCLPPAAFVGDAIAMAGLPPHRPYCSNHKMLWHSVWAVFPLYLPWWLWRMPWHRGA